MISELEFYASPGALTDLSDFDDFVDWLSSDPRVIFQVTQGLIVHDAWIERYGVKPRPEQERSKCTPSAGDILAQATQLRPAYTSLAIPRSPEERFVACCREFAVLATALFRAKGIPARARCGFARYFATPGFYEDHWVCEYWDAMQWKAIDPQVDPFQQSTLQDYAYTADGIDPEYRELLRSFDPLDVTAKHFINAGAAWTMYRNGDVDPNKFGNSSDPKMFRLESLHGAWFIRGQLLKDFAALNKVEAVPFLIRLNVGQDWKPWRLASAKDDELTADDMILLDTIASLCVKPDGKLREINVLFGSNKELQPPLE